MDGNFYVIFFQVMLTDQFYDAATIIVYSPINSSLFKVLRTFVF